MLKLIEKGINAYILLDPNANKKLKPLANKSIKFELSKPSLTFIMLFKSDKISIDAGQDQEADATIAGPSLELIMQQLKKTKTVNDIKITGDIETVENLNALFNSLDIDWEELLAQKTNDFFAYNVAQALKKLKDFAINTDTTFKHNVKDYLQEEAQQLPPKAAVDIFYNDVDDLRADVDRLAARINKLMLRKA